MEQVFESDNIQFVKVNESLVRDYLTMINDIEHVARFIGKRIKPISEETEVDWVCRKLEENAVIFSMIEKSSGEFIGNIELININDYIGELGITITAGKQNMGYGTEAILALIKYGTDYLRLKRIFLKVYPDNDRAIYVYKKCGFREFNRTDDDIFMEITLYGKII